MGAAIGRRTRRIQSIACSRCNSIITWSNRLLVEHVVDLQVLELAGLLGVLLEIVEVVAEVEGSDSFS